MEADEVLIGFETGLEKSEILGSGSDYFNVFKSRDENEAMYEFKKPHTNRNYLCKRMWNRKKHKIVYYEFDSIANKWVRTS